MNLEYICFKPSVDLAGGVKHQFKSELSTKQASISEFPQPRRSNVFRPLLLHSHRVHDDLKFTASVQINFGRGRCQHRSRGSHCTSCTRKVPTQIKRKQLHLMHETTPHAPKLTVEFLAAIGSKCEKLTIAPPAYSRNLYPVEKMWGMMKRASL